jgi:hypothetical protein
MPHRGFHDAKNGSFSPIDSAPALTVINGSFNAETPESDLSNFGKFSGTSPKVEPKQECTSRFSSKLKLYP